MVTRRQLLLGGAGAAGVALAGVAAWQVVPADLRRQLVLGGNGVTVSQPPTTVHPMPAQHLLDRWMINAHPTWGTGVYAHTSTVIELLADLGLPGIRDRVSGRTRPASWAALDELAARGVRLHPTLGVIGDSEEDVRAAARAARDHADLVVSVGGCNEPNATGPGWPDRAFRHQSWIWDELAGQTFPICGPALKDDVPDVAADFQALGATGIGSVADYADFHRYPLGDKPSNGLVERRDMAMDAFGGKASFCTEGGYNTSDSGVPEDVAAVYAPRQLLETAWSGIERFGVFELLDQSADPTVHAGHYGLVATPDPADVSTWRKKPSFDAIADLTSRLKDPGAAAPKPVTLGVAGPDDLRGLVLGWSDGSAAVCLWRDVTAGADPAPVTITTTTGTQTLDLADVYQLVRL